MRKFYHDFTRFTFTPDDKMKLTLGVEEKDPSLRDLHIGEEVLTIFPRELMATAHVVERRRSGEYAFWFAAVDTIVDLPLEEPFAGYPKGYDGEDFWEELRQQNPRFAAIQDEIARWEEMRRTQNG